MRKTPCFFSPEATHPRPSRTLLRPGRRRCSAPPAPPFFPPRSQGRGRSPPALPSFFPQDPNFADSAGGVGEDLLGLDWDLAGADGGCGEPVGEALDDVAVRDGVVEVAQPLLHLRHLRVREPERRPPCSAAAPSFDSPKLLRRIRRWR